MPTRDLHRRVLVVDDDERVRTAVTWALEAEGFAVEQAADGVGALERLAADPPSLVVLDLSLPGMGGLDVLRRLRNGPAPGELAGPAASDVPVIVLSGRDGETDRIVGLDLGADDYLVKPFSPGELAARVRSVLRRSVRESDRPPAHWTLPAPATPATAPPAALVAAPSVVTSQVRVDLDVREVTVSGRPVELTAKEFDLVAFLADNPRRVFTRAQLLDRVWASNAGWQSEATVTEHVHRLRHKLEPDPKAPRHLRTVRGVGYRWEP